MPRATNARNASERELDMNWQHREWRRNCSGRKLPVWYDERWWQRNSDIHACHFVHVSETDPTCLAYTETPSKGERDIQTKIKPGRYLQKYFGHILTPKQIKSYAQWQTTGRLESEYTDPKVWKLDYASTAEDIIRVYVRGPSSCMDGGHFNENTSPVRVYAAGDLAVAYLHNPDANNHCDGEKDYIRARCLVWPARKVAGRVYPTPENYWQEDNFDSQKESMACRDALYSRLRDAGYRFVGEDDDASFSGARLLKIEKGSGSYLMPYLDKDYNVKDDGDCFRMSEHDGYDCSNTDGRVYLNDDRKDYDFYCENCEEPSYEYDAVQVATDYVRPQVVCWRSRYWQYSSWCQDCVDNYTFFCEGSSETVSRNLRSIEIEGETYSFDWARAHGAYCSDLSGVWYWADQDPPVTVNGDTWAGSELESWKAEHPGEEPHSHTTIDAPEQSSFTLSSLRELFERTAA